MCSLYQMVVPLKVNNKIQILYLCVLIRNPEKDVYWKSITAPVLECSLPYDLTKTVSPFCRSITAMLLPDEKYSLSKAYVYAILFRFFEIVVSKCFPGSARV